MSQGIAAANELEQAILREGPDTVAMFIAEPVQGAGGVIVPQDDYFPRIREICDQYDVLLVSDEVITGFGRTGRMFGLEHWGVKPDMIQFAKAITSGYFPLGGIGISDEIADVMDAANTPWMHAYTYSAHPVGCAIGVAMLGIIERDGYPEMAAHKGRRLLVHLKDALGDHPHVGDIRGLGLMCAVEYVEDRATREELRRGGERRGPNQLGDDRPWDVLALEGRSVLPRAAHHDIRGRARPDGGHPRGVDPRRPGIGGTQGEPRGRGEPRRPPLA